MEDWKPSAKSYSVLLITLDESFKRVFGKTAAEAVYYHLEKSYQLKFRDIPEKPCVYYKAMKELFGETGAKLIACLLAEELIAKLGRNTVKKIMGDWLRRVGVDSDTIDVRLSEESDDEQHLCEQE